MRILIKSLLIISSFIVINTNVSAQTAENEHIASNSLGQTTAVSNQVVLQSLNELPTRQSFTAPYVQEIYTDNKVRTLFVESHGLPIVDIQLTFNAGSARDQSIGSGLYGLAHLTAQLLNEGTNTQSANDIAETFDRLGAQYHAQAYRDMFIIKLRVMSDETRLYPALDQMIQLLQGATFPSSSIQRILNNAQIGQKQVQENPARTMTVRFYRAVYADHPYAEPSTGTIQSLRRINSKLIQQFRDQYLVANNMNIAITGDLNSIQAKKIAHQISQSLKQGNAADPLPDAKQLEKSQIISLPFNSNQAHIMLGQIAIKQNDPDRFALEVGNEILGNGGFNSLLMQQLREKHGYTYSVSSSLNSMQSQGLFSFSYATQQEQLMPSIQVAYQTLLDFLYQPLSEKLVEETKLGMLKAFPQMLSSNANINAQLGAIGFYQLPSNYLNEYPTYISSVTAQNIQDAWQRHIDPQRMLTIVAGKDIDADAIAQTFRQLLQKQLNQSRSQNVENKIISNQDSSF